MSTSENPISDEMEAFNVWCTSTNSSLEEINWIETNIMNNKGRPYAPLGNSGDTWDTIPSTSAEGSDVIPISDPSFPLLVNKGDIFQSCTHYVVPVKCKCSSQVVQMICKKCLVLFCGVPCLQNKQCNGLSKAIKNQVRSTSSGHSGVKKTETVTNNVTSVKRDDRKNTSHSESRSFVQREKFTKIGEVFESRYPHPESERQPSQQEKNLKGSNYNDKAASTVLNENVELIRPNSIKGNVVSAIDDEKTWKVLRDQQYGQGNTSYILTTDNYLTVDDAASSVINPSASNNTNPSNESVSNTIIGRGRGQTKSNNNEFPVKKLTRTTYSDNPIDHTFPPPAMTVFEMGCLYVETPHLLSLATQEGCKRNVKIMKDIKSIPSKNKVVDVYEGDYVLTAYDDTETLYRAKVLNVKNDMAEVYYIDFGNIDKRKKDCLFELPESLRAIQPVVIRFKICNVQQPESLRWSKDAIRFLNKLCFEKTVRCLVQYVSETPAGPLYAGTMKVDTGDRWMDVGERLVTNRFAKKCTPGVISSFVHADSQLKIQTYPEIDLLESNTKSPEFQIDQHMEGDICYATGPNNFFIVLSNEKDDRESLMSKLNNSMRNPELCAAYQAENGPLCTVFVKDQWWRGLVLLIKKDQSVEVLLIDVGKIVKNGLNLCDLKKLSNELKRHKWFAYRCQLPTLPSDVWSSQLFEKLKTKKIHSYHNIGVTCFYVEKGLHTVELYPPIKSEDASPSSSISQMETNGLESKVPIQKLNGLKNIPAPEIPDTQLQSFMDAPVKPTAKTEVDKGGNISKSDVTSSANLSVEETENIYVAEELNASEFFLPTSAILNDPQKESKEVAAVISDSRQNSINSTEETKENVEIVEELCTSDFQSPAVTPTEDSQNIQSVDAQSDPESFQSCPEPDTVLQDADTSDKVSSSLLEISSGSFDNAPQDEVDDNSKTSSGSIVMNTTTSKFSMENLPTSPGLSTLIKRNEKFFVFLTNIWGVVYIIPQFSQRNEINDCLKDYMAQYKDTNSDFVPQENDIVVIKLNRKAVRAVVDTKINGSEAHLRLLDRGDDVIVPVNKIMAPNTEIMMFPPLGYLVKLVGVSDETKLFSSKIKDLNTNLKSNLYILDSLLGPDPLEPSMQMANMKVADESDTLLSDVITTLSQMNWEIDFEQGSQTTAEIIDKRKWPVKTEEEFYNLEEDINLNKPLSSTVLRAFIFQKDLMIVFLKPENKQLQEDIKILNRKMELYYSKVRSSKKKPKGPFVAIRVVDEPGVIRSVFDTTWHRCIKSGNNLLALDHQIEWQEKKDKQKITEIRDVCPEFLEIQSACFLAKYSDIDFTIEANNTVIEQVFSPGCKPKFELTAVDKEVGEKPIYTIKCPSFEKLKVVNETEANPFKEPHQNEEFWN